MEPTIRRLPFFSIAALLACARAAAAILLAGSAIAAGAPTLNLDRTVERPLRYHPDGGDFVIENGPESFNRPLYGSNSAFRIDGGDKPEFSLYLPGKGGNLRLGVHTPGGAKWLNGAARVVMRYRPGSLLYEISDPLLSGRTLRLAVIPLPDSPGLVLRAALDGTGEPVELIWAYGGASGERGRRDGDIGTESEPVSRFFQLRADACRNNSYTIAGGAFVLKSPKASIRGVASAGAHLVVGDAAKWDSAADILGSAADPSEPVLVGRIVLPSAGAPVYLALQRVPSEGDDRGALSTYLEVGAPDADRNVTRVPGGREPTPENLDQIFGAAEARRRSVAEKISVETPDPFIDAAAGALCVAADAVWDEASGTVQHGAVAWRTALLGWRGPYANDELGWHDRALRHFTYWARRQNTAPIPEKIPGPDSAANLSRNEAALHSNGDISNTHYDMNLVYIDALYRHLLWTGDVGLARRMWPVIVRHLAWEQRLFRRPFGPDGLPLYEAYCCIWASDDVAYEGGGATHSTAYNFYENVAAARLARLLGEDPAPYDREAGLIWRALHHELWLPDRGWYAEWKDLLGLQAVHASPALWTFYHTVDSGAATPFEAWQMTRFIDTQIAHIPIRGPGEPGEGDFVLPTTNWMPYTWSTNNVVMAEVAHTSLGYWQAGRPEEAYRMFKGSVLTSMFLGLCPGNAGMTTTFDMARGESQRDFADAAGTASRALVEGLFGVVPDALAGELRIRPGFPANWDHARLGHPDFDFAFRRADLADTYVVDPRFPRPMALRLQVVARRDHVAGVTINGAPAKWRILGDAVGAPILEITAAAAPHFEVAVTWSGEIPASPVTAPVAALGSTFKADFGPARVLAVEDPQQMAAHLDQGANSFSAVASGAEGFRTVFAQLRQGDLSWWSPVAIETRPAFQILPGRVQDAKGLRFRLRNNTNSAVAGIFPVTVGGSSVDVSIGAPAHGDSPEIELAADGILPGTNRVSVELGGEIGVEGLVTSWKLAAPAAARFEAVDLSANLNDRVTQIYRNKYLTPRSPYCSLAMPLQGIGTWCRFQAAAQIDDTGLRSAAAKNNGHVPVAGGVWFATTGSPDANNIAYTSQWDNYPRESMVPVRGRAAHAYLLMAGSTNSMQSRSRNGEVVVTYKDGSTERLVLENPTNWWPIDEDYWIDDYAFSRPDPIPPRVDLRTGRARMLDAASFAGHGRSVPGGAAVVLDLPLRPEKDLKSLTVRALDNEVVIGLMAVTLAR